MRDMRGRAASVFKEEPGTSGRARGPDTVDEPDSRGWGDRCANGSALGEEPLIERLAMNANETPELDVGEITPANQVPKVTLGDSGVGREGLEVEELGPGAGCCAAAVNRRSERLYSTCFICSFLCVAICERQRGACRQQMLGCQCSPGRHSRAAPLCP
jgi:hypothetical protein